MTPVLRNHYVEDEPCIYFDDESWHDSDRMKVRRNPGGLWQRGGYDSYMADDEWESLEGSDSRRLENEYQRLVKAGEIEDIDLLPERPRWIPVTERLPEEDVRVLVFDKAFGREMGTYYATDGWVGDGIAMLDPSHWMPLPEPPDCALHNRERDGN